MAKKHSGSVDSKLKIASITSSVMWIAAFLLLFIFKEGDKNVWISDALMLTGFWPVLFVYRAGWTWFLFGILNMAIGFILEVARQLPEEVYTQASLSNEMILAKEHVLTMHPCMPWIIIGFLSMLYGLFRITKTIFRWIRKGLAEKNSREKELD